MISYKVYLPFMYIHINIFLLVQELSKDGNGANSFVFAFTQNNVWTQYIVIGASFLCMITVILAAMMGIPRILFQMSKDVLFLIFTFLPPYPSKLICRDYWEIASPC